ncbi:dipeptidase [Mariniblastus sp.]|nr:dipeptidase [Mariniblastus sp.]MDA7922907.1 dipeptidase [bacterium]MDA7924103.1 dipeptidase [Mariniblastus sp.]MDB4380814.1 dipeptidase [Mariniblastus sp.]MDB4480808.1 dipeptidase [bacterium]
MSEFDSYLSENHDRFESDLFEWLRMPSIGTDSAYDADVRKTAEWLAQKFIDMGLKTETIETCGHPLIYAESPKVEGAPTVLVYGHYDVQPPDPLELWETPPFEPTVRDGKVFARGATDDKGQMITHVFGVEAYLKTKGALPIQVKFLIEGEEESGGAGLKAFLNGEYDVELPVKEKISADIAVISDCSQYGPGQPAITYGLKGITYYQVNLTGPNRDLHSGGFGGTVANPANVLCKMMAALIDENGRVQVPGFYDDVEELSEREREQFSKLGFSDEDYQKELGVKALAGEKGYTTLERRWARPTFDINGLWSGYQGEGAKTVLPAKAGAKFSCRLVPNQNPEVIQEGMRKMLEALCPESIEMEFIALHGAPGFVLSLDSPYMEAAADAIEQGFGVRPVFVRSGGSIPVVNAFTEMLGIDTLLLGWGQDDDNLHSPNEKFSLEDFHRGIKSSCCLWDEVAKIAN